MFGQDREVVEDAYGDVIGLNKKCLPLATLGQWNTKNSLPVRKSSAGCGIPTRLFQELPQGRKRTTEEGAVQILYDTDESKGIRFWLR